MSGRDLCKGKDIGGRKGKVEEILGDVGLVWGIGDSGEIYEYLGPHARTLMSRSYVCRVLMSLSWEGHV